MTRNSDLYMKTHDKKYGDDTSHSKIDSAHHASNTEEISQEAKKPIITLKKINEFTWEIPKDAQMKVPALMFSNDTMLLKIKEDDTLRQLRNMACLKGIVKNAIAMPDAHRGYGFCIGGVAAFDLDEGIISPGGVGYDINCGVRLLRTNYTEADIKDKRKELLNEIFSNVPAGVGKKGITKLSEATLRDVSEKGAKWAVENGYGTKDDLETTEEYGCIAGADFSCVSAKARDRGIPQLGTLGSGNHFLEIQRVDEILDKDVAKAFGIDKVGQIMVMIHCGSRGYGHQIASDYIKLMEDAYGFKDLPDRELINAPIHSELGQKYMKAMACAINYAFANRQMIMHWTRESFKKVMGNDDGMEMVYDVCHNIAKIEEHTVDGKAMKVCVHRKGATRSFGPGRVEIPKKYRAIGQPVIIPGSMGTFSYVLVGTKKAEDLTFGSTAHGAGRVSSRSEALRNFRGEKVVSDLKKLDIEVKGVSWSGIAEEAPQVYKDIDQVVAVSHAAGIGNIVARLKPLAVMKG
jgi:tRNA-splicing ligase RtcB (3'-phosphate/5'-hydroxy nucleic acid ligase)